MFDAEQHFRDTQIARMLGVNPVTVRQWRVKNKRAGCIKYGPPYEIHGGDVVYPKEQFRQWCATRAVVGGVPQLNLPATADLALIRESVGEVTLHAGA